MDSQDRRKGETENRLAQPPGVGDAIELDNHSDGDSGDDDQMKINTIYDNGGRTLDRYTVVTNQIHSGNYRMALGIGSDPQDFIQWTGVTVGDHLGKVVAFETLDGKLQEHIALRVFGKDE